MTASVVVPMLGVYAGVAAGWLLGRLGWLDRAARAAGRSDVDPVRLLARLAFTVFVPALLFRTMARIDATGLPWGPLVAYFAPAVAMLLAVAAWSARRRDRVCPAPPEGPAVTAITATFSNTAQLGIPVAAALFGESGLALHLGIIALHALVLMTLATVLAEVARARAAGRDGARGLGSLVLQTARHALIHPVVLPVLAGLAWNATGWPLPAGADRLLAVLAAVAVPLCLLLLGLSLAGGDAGAALRRARGPIAFKLIAFPAGVAAVAGGLAGLSGTALQVLVMAAALPAGSNALLFAQRYRVAEADTAAAVVGSTVLYAATAPLWLLLLRTLG